MKIFHAADIHLGRRRLDGRLPDKDFADAFAFIADQAIEARADVFLLAGDLFDRAQVEPPHLRQAQQVLSRFKQARIPVLAIEGNHDKAFLHSEAPTWLNYLAEDQLLTLLRTPFDSSGPLLTPWTSPQTGGAWLDLGGVRFIGAGYLGAATPYKVRQIAARLDPARTNVLLLHAGPEYFAGEGGGISREDLEFLRARVCYLALGHIHKPMMHGEWACNPGSPENCDWREASWDGPRGYAVVEIDPERRNKPLSIEIRTNPRRACHQVTLDCTAFGNKLKNGAASLVQAAVEQVRFSRAGREGWVALHLTGKLNLDRIALDQAWACEQIEKAAFIRAVALDTTGLNVDPTVANLADPTENLSREELEKAAIRSLVDSGNLWGLDGREPDFASLCYDLKEAVRAGRTGEEIAEQLSRSPLVEMIRASIEAAKASPAKMELL